MPEIFLTKGQSLRIELPAAPAGNEPRKTVKASICELADSNFLVEIIEQDRNRTSLLADGEVNLLIGRNGRLFTGQSCILDFENDTHAWMRLSNPQNIRRIEMRRWARVPADLHIHYCLKNYSWSLYEASTLDVGGGGLLFSSRHIVDPELILEMGIRLPNEQIIESLVEVKRCEGFSTRWGDRFRIGCSFKHIQEDHRDKLIKFIINRQRDMIKRGLLSQAN